MMFNKLMTGLVVAILGLTLCKAQAASTVKDIVIKNVGAGKIDESYVRAFITVKVGVPLDPQMVSKDVKALLGSGRFSWVSSAVEDQAGGVKVTYSFRCKYRLDKPVAVKGCEYYREGKIVDLMNFQPGDLVDEQTVGVSLQQVIQKYHEDYFPDVKVTAKITEVDHERGTANVTVDIEENGRAKILDVVYLGNTVFAASDLQKCMKQPAWWNPCWWMKKKRYDPGELESAKAEIINLYMGRGYVNAKVDVSEAAYDDKGNLKIIVTIVEGPLFHFGKISIKGAKLFPEVELNRCLKVKSGEPASSEKMRESQQGLEDYYGSRGYVDSRIRPVLDTDETTRIINLEFNIVEGSQFKIRNIKIQGNTRTKDKVIRRELLVYPGEIYDEVKVKRSERVITNLGYFKTVHSYPTKTLVPDQRDLIMEVEEQRTGQFMVSAGFSSVDNVIGMVELSQGNFDLFGWPYFTGGGQKLKLTTEFGSTTKRYEISFVEPWFLDKKLSLGVDLYISDLSYTDYDIDRIGAAVTLGKPLTRADRVELQYSIEKASLSNITDTNAYVRLDNHELYYFSQEPDTFKSTMMLTLKHDTTDNPFLPTKGNRSSIFGSVSGGVLGLDTDIYHLGATMNQYFPLWLGHVFSLRGRYEVVDCYSDTESVPIMDRLFLGGGRTLRGFNYRDVGPKAITQSDYDQGVTTGLYRPLGGKSLAMATAEYTIPVVSHVRIAFFLDAGNDWADAYEFSFHSPAVSTGVGLRLDLPGFPIKIDYGYVLRKDDPLTDKAPWVIWIGPDF